MSCIESYDIDGDGVPELISGWTSGKFEARREANAEVVYRDHFSAPLSALEKVGCQRPVCLRFFPLIHRSHSISFTRAQGIPRYKIGLGGKRMGELGEIG